MFSYFSFYPVSFVMTSVLVRLIVS
jgi:hypothetical protein